MSQKRIQDFNSPIVARALKTLVQSITQPGILSGNELVVDAADRVRINPGTCVTNQGVLIIEDETKFLTIVNTSVPVDYTMYYAHVDQDISGGIPALLTLDTGLLTAEVIQGVIIGYIRYPGGGIPLSESHFIEPYPLTIGDVLPTKTNSNWLVPIKNTGYMVTTTGGATLNITDTWDISGLAPMMFVKIRNNGLVNGNVTLTFPFKTRDKPFAYLQMILATDINAIVNARYIDSIGTNTLLTPSYSGDTSLSLKEVQLPRDQVYQANILVYVQLEISLAASREVKLQSIGLNSYNLPL